MRVVVELSLTWIFANTPMALGQDDNLFAGDIVLLDGFAHNLLGDSIGVGIGRVPGVEAAVVCCLEEGQGLRQTIDELEQLVTPGYCCVDGGLFSKKECEGEFYRPYLLQ